MKTSPGGRNILLHFLDRENRKVWKLYSNANRAVHVRLLSDALRLSVFLCKEFCLLTPGAILDCEISRGVLLAHPSFLASSLVRFPLREGDLDEFLNKRRREYGPYHDDYPHMSLIACARLLRKYPQCVIARKTTIGESLAAHWEAGPDIANEVASGFDAIYPGHVEVVRHIPSELRGRGLGVTWSAISSELSQLGGAISNVGQILLQREYFQAYLREFPFTTLTGLPFDTVEVVRGDGGLAYDYRALREGLMAAKIWNLILGIPDEELVQLRSERGYFAFRNGWEKCCASLTLPREVGAFVAEKAGGVLKKLGTAYQRYLDRIGFRILREQAKLSLATEDLSLLDEYLAVLGDQMAAFTPEEDPDTLVARKEQDLLHGGGHIMSAIREPALVAVFVALAEERDLL